MHDMSLIILCYTYQNRNAYFQFPTIVERYKRYISSQRSYVLKTRKLGRAVRYVKRDEIASQSTVR